MALKALCISVLLATITLTTSVETLPTSIADDTCLLQTWQQALLRSPRGAPAFATPPMLQNYERLPEGLAQAGALSLDAPLMVASETAPAPLLAEAQLGPDNWPRLNQMSNEVAPASANIDMNDVQKDIAELMELNKQLEQKVQDERATPSDPRDPSGVLLQQQSLQQPSLPQQSLQQQSPQQQPSLQQQSQRVAIQQPQTQELEQPKEKVPVSNILSGHSRELAASSSHVRAESSSESDNDYGWSLYAFYILEGMILVCCCVFGVIGGYNDFLKSKFANRIQQQIGIVDDEAIDIDYPWYCEPCVSVSQCVCGTLNPLAYFCFEKNPFKPWLLIVVVVYIAVMNFFWARYASLAFKQYVNLFIMYAFAVCCVVGLVIGTLYVMWSFLMKIDEVRELVHGIGKLNKLGHHMEALEHNVDMLTTFFQSMYGKKFSKAIMNSNKYTKEQLANMKGGMKKAGAYSKDKWDDITDFLGITEASSEEDVTAKDIMTDTMSSWRGEDVAAIRAKRKEERRKKKEASEGKTEEAPGKSSPVAKKKKSMGWSLSGHTDDELEAAKSAPASDDEGAAAGGGCCRRSSSAPPRSRGSGADLYPEDAS